MDRAPTPITQGFDNWHASIDLAYARTAQGTVPVRRLHSGPLRVQKHLYPEGNAVCQHIIVHPPGGIAGGDQLNIRIEVQEHAHALLTSPGAAKWYRSYGRRAEQHVQAEVAAGGVLEWLPQETMLFNGADIAVHNQFNLASDAALMWIEVTCLGRSASGERFVEGNWRQKNTIRRDGKLIWHEQINLPAASPLLNSPIGLAGMPVTASLIWAGAALPAEVTEACRQLQIDGRLAITQLPDVWVARYIGNGAEAAQHALRAAWALIRPAALGRSAQAPRIWAT